uniref:Putative secreted peptide n=1 Tax=Anopheles braziliensis TaxID=58242 RepID=A0A2M3ZQH2_9DIPT
MLLLIDATVRINFLLDLAAPAEPCYSRWFTYRHGPPYSVLRARATCRSSSSSGGCCLSTYALDDFFHTCWAAPGRH